MTVATHGGSVRLHSLTGLRACAALAVYARHVVAFQSIDGWPRVVVAAGNTGVSFFFILSGFVLAWSMRPGTRYGAFWRNRAARILPLYLLSWTLAAVGVVVLATDDDPVRHLTPSLLLVQAWFPDAVYYFAGNSALWSVSTEAFFYAVFPLVVPSLLRLSKQGLLAVAVACPVSMLLVAVVLHPTAEASTAYWGIYVLPPVRLLEFVLGIVLALLVARRAVPHVSLTAAVVVVLVGLVASDLAPLNLQVTVMTVVPFALLVVAAAATDVSGRRSVFSHPWMIKLGEWSYAFYVLHLVVLQVVIRGNGLVGLPWWVVGVVALPVTVVVSALTCELIEKPLERRLRTPARLRPYGTAD